MPNTMMIQKNNSMEAKTKKILLANPRGFCAGVERAVTIVEKALAKYSHPIYVRHEVVHNKYVVDKLKSQGAIFIENIDDVPENSILIYSAHGVPNSVRQSAEKKNLQLILDATCPLVSKVHIEVKHLHKNGYKIIMIGHSGHPEVEGTMGQIASDIYLIENIADIDKLTIDHNTKKIAVVTQTTLSVDDTNIIIQELKNRFKYLHLPRNEDICYATQNRQDAVKHLAPLCDLMLVIGSKNSSNSNRLKELAENLGVTAYLIDSYLEIDAKWFLNSDMLDKSFTDCNLDNLGNKPIYTIGVTAGASAPEVLVDGVLKELKKYDFNTVETITTVDEHMIFALPSAIRDL